jgi:hypothetical protein
MLIGLLRMRRYGGCGLANLLWKQVWWLLTTCDYFGSLIVLLS